MNIADGTYNNVTAMSAELVESSQKKTPGVEVLHRLEDGNEIRSTHYLSPAALPFTVKALDAMGWTGNDISDLSSIGSKLYQIVVKGEEYNGNWYPKVAFVNPNESTGGGTGQPKMDDTAKKRFAAQMKGQIIAARGGPVQKPAPKGAGGAPRPSQPQAPANMGPPSPPLDQLEPPSEDIPF